MSGDVQPRKRKDKRKKKDDLGVEEPRGTAAALGDGDVFMHSYSDHGTGGHWCAKIIFFSLLAILVTLIGLIILENRGLSELEANSVESRYSGVLEGWLEDVPDDDHHDAHTLELNHPDEEHDDHEDHEEDEEPEEVEKLEEEFPDEEPISTELPALPEDNDDEDDKQLEESVEEDEIDNEPNDADDDDEFLSPDDEDLPIIEHITAPAGKPYVEVDEDDTSTELSPDTLKDEEEYERQQEELRREEEEAAAASQKDGGNSIGDAWPGEPSEAYWRQQLDDSEEDVQQGKWMAAFDRVSAPELQASGRARYIAATALDKAAEARRDNSLLSRAIAAYLHLLKMNENLSDEKLLQIANRTLDRIMFRGNYLSAEPVYKLLIRRFPNEINYRNKLSISYLMANRADLAEGQLKETLKKWPNDRVALAHYGFVLKTEHNRVEESIDYFQRALEGDTGPANEPRFYYHLGDAYLLLGRFAEAHEVHKRGTSLGHFLSPAQRSLYNVKRLKSRPWWNIEQTPYARLARTLERSWKEILKEGMAAKALYEQEKEGLKERGEWSQLDLFARGREIPGRCQRAPVTCSIIKSEGADGCSRGQIKFSSMEAGTHVRPHVGPTNCRLRMHLGLSNTDNTYIRVDQETRQWKLGKVFMFDDSFEHEVWHNGTGTRLVLIVDVWHPALTPLERRQLPAI